MKSRSATETLMAAMTQFSQAEPQDCLIIWTDDGGDMCWFATTDSKMTKLGMVEFVSTILRKQIEDEL